MANPLRIGAKFRNVVRPDYASHDIEERYYTNSTGPAALVPKYLRDFWHWLGHSAGHPEGT